MNKILITIQGKTLLLYYQIRLAMLHSNLKFPAYIHVIPSDELAGYDLKGLTPEMFCVNIADMVNMRGIFHGQVENERQLPVARWTMNRDEYLDATRKPLKNLTHQQIVQILSLMPDYAGESDSQYIDIEECVISHTNGENTTCGGYQLTIMTEKFEDDIQSYAYFKLNTQTAKGWLDCIPPIADFEIIRKAIDKKLQAINDAGVKLKKVVDETDYALAS